MVNLDADDEDNVEDQTRLMTCQSRGEETLLAETWVEASQNAEIGNDRSDEEDFNMATKCYPRTKNMIQGKWSRVNRDFQKFNAVYKLLQRRSGENEANHIENATINFSQRFGGTKLNLVHA